MEIKRVYIDCRYAEQKKEVLNDLRKNNYRVAPIDNYALCDLYIAFDKIDELLLNSLANHVFKVLVRQEPKVVVMETYTTGHTEKFNHVIDVGKIEIGTISVINWPQDLLVNIDVVNGKSEKIVMINSNLLSLSKSENYSLRRQVAIEINDLDLYGRQWNNEFKAKLLTLIKEVKKYRFQIHRINFYGLKYYFRVFSNYLGEVEDKRKTLSKYKYSIVIENSSDYLSEKIFDAIFSGCIPIYVGPNLVNYEIPDYLYLQAKPDLSDIKEKIASAKTKDYSEWVDQVRIWSMDPKTYNSWSRDLFVSKIFSKIAVLYQ
jgi:hypothetical protein